MLIQLKICLLLMMLPPALKAVVAHHADAPVIARHDCKDTCGDVSIPFPFGIGKNCSRDHWFEIECKASPNSSGSLLKPFLSNFSFEVMEINIDYNNDYGSQSLVVAIPPRNVCSVETQTQQQRHIDLRGSPYTISTQDNVFVVKGCPGNAVLRNQSHNILAGCATVCNNSNNNDNNNSAIPPNSCYGVQCCQTPLPFDYFDSYSISFYQVDFYDYLPASGETQNCLVATLIKGDSVTQYAEQLSSSDPSSSFPAVLYWKWIRGIEPDYNSHAHCTPEEDNSLLCDCSGHHYGNAYVSNGCRVPKDCKGCRGYCTPLFEWDGEKQHRIPNAYQCEDNLFKFILILGLGIIFGIVFLVVGIYGLYRFIKRRREMKRRAKFFKRNGGLLLQQQLSSNEGIPDKTKIFTTSELDKATDHFNENRILGQGGQGTVYKGMLVDGRTVAIKKSKLLDESQLEQFINEVVILSQVNHRNVVKLFGCCLETEVPLLVYEYIPNGTLAHHIHDPDEDFVISWEMRLKIAADSAAAIAYLHSSSSIPIYHRDIKSSNILLDEKHRARVSDFGSSKTIAIDQTHLTTLVQGTMGYLDPEYFQSYQFTDKSDVYSFGVVLLEILTGKSPIYRDANTMEQKSLVTEFLLLIDDSALPDILDPEIVEQAKMEELIAVVELTKCCISWSGKLRPTMKQVEMTLEMIMKSPDQASTCYQQAIPVPDDGLPSSSSAISPLYIDVQPLLPHTI